MADLRVGIGFDAHAFADGRKLVLAGVEIDHPRGLAGHSDADLILTQSPMHCWVRPAARTSAASTHPTTPRSRARPASTCWRGRGGRWPDEAGRS